MVTKEKLGKVFNWIGELAQFHLTKLNNVPEQCKGQSSLPLPMYWTIPRDINGQGVFSSNCVNVTRLINMAVMLTG